MKTFKTIVFILKLILIKALLMIPRCTIWVLNLTALILKEVCKIIENEVLDGEIRQSYGRNKG